MNTVRQTIRALFDSIGRNVSLLGSDGRYQWQQVRKG